MHKFSDFRFSIKRQYQYKVKTKIIIAKTSIKGDAVITIQAYISWKVGILCKFEKHLNAKMIYTSSVSSHHS